MPVPCAGALPDSPRSAATTVHATRATPRKRPRQAHVATCQAVSQRTRQSGWLYVFDDRMTWTPADAKRATTHWFCNVTAVRCRAPAILVDDAVVEGPAVVYVCSFRADHDAVVDALRPWDAFPRHACVPTQKKASVTLTCHGVTRADGERGTLAVRHRTLRWFPTSTGARVRILDVDADLCVVAQDAATRTLAMRYREPSSGDVRSMGLTVHDPLAFARLRWALQCLRPGLVVRVDGGAAGGAVELAEGDTASSSSTYDEEHLWAQCAVAADHANQPPRDDLDKDFDAATPYVGSAFKLARASESTSTGTTRQSHSDVQWCAHA
jgi:hypothetical protein